ncbi:MAG: hypothetical protein PHW87_10055 [Methanothrix sp.]|nr:hypothetical protein [Methanothrix sp.]
MIHQVAAIAGTLQAEKRLKEAKKKAQEQEKAQKQEEGTDEDGRMK